MRQGLGRDRSKQGTIIGEVGLYHNKDHHGYDTVAEGMDTKRNNKPLFLSHHGRPDVTEQASIS